jgi:TM2 domain-containing membrane protein YozV
MSNETEMVFCRGCGKSIHCTARACPGCGAVPSVHRYGQKNRLMAALFALFFGAIGIHKFYLGKIGQGILCILFCWTGIPTIIGIIEFIIYICMSDEEFAAKFG